MPPFDISKLIEMAPLIAGALKPGSPEAAAMMRGYMRSQEMMRARGLQDRELAREDELHKARIAGLQADDQYRRDSLNLQRESAGRQRTEAFYDRLPDLQSAAVEQHTDPVAAQEAYIRSKASAAQDFGVPMGAGQALPNMGALISTRQKNQARTLYDDALKTYGEEAMANDAITIQSPIFGQVKPSALRAMFSAPAVDASGQAAKPYVKPKPTKEPDKPSIWVMKGGAKRYVTPGQAAQMSAEGWEPYEKGTGDPAQVTKEAEDARTSAREVVRIARELRNHKGLPGAFGVLSARTPTLRQATADAERLRDTLISKLTMENIDKLKGVLSDADLKMLRESSTTLGPTMGDAAAIAELDRLIAVMEKLDIASEAPGFAPMPSHAPATTGGDTDSALSILEQRRRSRGL